MRWYRIKLIALGTIVMALWLGYLFTAHSCSSLPTYQNIRNSFVGRDYYDVGDDLGSPIWGDFKGDELIRAYRKGDCVTILHINRKNLITSWETSGKCE